MTAIFKREFKAYFNTPVGYIVLAAFYFFLGLYFYVYFAGGSPFSFFIVLDMKYGIFLENFNIFKNIVTNVYKDGYNYRDKLV